MQMVPQLLRKRAKSQTYGLLTCRRAVLCVFSDGTGNCVIKTPIKGAKFINRDRRSGFKG